MLGLNLSLSLSRQAMMADHRQRAARMNRDELHQLADELIQRCHQQEHLILELQKAAANLMVQNALDGALPLSEPKADHYAMARDMAEQALQINEGRPDGPLQQWARQVLGR